MHKLNHTVIAGGVAMSCKDNAMRKNATYKTKLINEEIYTNIDWNKLKIEEELAKKNVVVDVQLPVIKKECSRWPIKSRIPTIP